MNYWLSPTGRVITCELGRHLKVAIEFCETTYRDECIEKGILDENGIINTRKDVIGFIEDKGWIRYEDWTKDPRWLIWDRRPTKKQIEMMFELTGYFYKTDET